MSKIIGLTGGIGSGKTTVANLFRSYGIPVYIADEEAKKLLDTDNITKSIIRAFGESIINDDTIDRKKLAAIVFNNPDKLAKLNSIVHPAVRKHFLDWVKENQKFPILIKEAAILFESGNDKDCDAIITVTAPIQTRIARVMERDKSSREDIVKRIENQWSDERKIAQSDYVIHNTSLIETERQVSKTLKKLQNL